MLDLYGRQTVYEGEAFATGERYLVWFGKHGSMTAPNSYRRLGRAIREARRLQHKGYDVKITDRLVQEKEA